MTQAELDEITAKLQKEMDALDAEIERSQRLLANARLQMEIQNIALYGTVEDPFRERGK